MKYGKCMIAVLMVMALAVGMLGCGSAKPVVSARQLPPVEAPITDEMTMVVKEGTVSGDALVVVLSNASDGYMFSYGNSFGIERYQDGTWIDLYEGKMITDTLEAYIMTAGKSHECEVRWADQLGSLPAGEYRVVQYVQKHPADAEDLTEPVEEYTLYARFSL